MSKERDDAFMKYSADFKSHLNPNRHFVFAVGWEAAIDACLKRLHQDTNELAWDAAKDIALLKDGTPQ